MCIFFYLLCFIVEQNSSLIKIVSRYLVCVFPKIFHLESQTLAPSLFPLRAALRRADGRVEGLGDSFIGLGGRLVVALGLDLRGQGVALGPGDGLGLGAVQISQALQGLIIVD